MLSTIEEKSGEIENGQGKQPKEGGKAAGRIGNFYGVYGQHECAFDSQLLSAEMIRFGQQLCTDERMAVMNSISEIIGHANCIISEMGGLIDLLANMGKRINENGPGILPPNAPLAPSKMIGTAAMNPAKTVFDTKCLIDRKFDDPAVQFGVKHIGVQTECDSPTIQLVTKCKAKTFFLDEILAIDLAKIKETAGAFLGQQVKICFNDSHNPTVTNVGIISCLNIPRIIDESKGAATFKVPILAIVDVFEAKAAAGVTRQFKADELKMMEEIETIKQGLANRFGLKAFDACEAANELQTKSLKLFEAAYRKMAEKNQQQQQSSAGSSEEAKPAVKEEKKKQEGGSQQ